MSPTSPSPSAVPGSAIKQPRVSLLSPSVDRIISLPRILARDSCSLLRGFLFKVFSGKLPLKIPRLEITLLKQLESNAIIVVYFGGSKTAQVNLLKNLEQCHREKSLQTTFRSFKKHEKNIILTFIKPLSFDVFIFSYGSSAEN